MANDKSFKIKNGLKAGRYLGSNGTETAGTNGPYGVFDTTLYEGTASAQTITNNIALSTDGGMVWSKNRDGTDEPTIIDTVIGTGFYGNTNGNSAYLGSSNAYITAFNSNGYALGSANQLNRSGNSFVSWTFKKQTKFFDVVTYTGDGTNNRNIAHSLGNNPGFIVVKTTSHGGDWVCWHRSLGTDGIILNSANAKSGYTAVVNYLSQSTSSNLIVGTNDLNESGRTYVAYLFAHDTAADGYIQCGSTTQVSGGTTVDLGWEPQWVLIRAATTSNWFIFDNKRGGSLTLLPNLSNAEGSQGAGAFEYNTTGFTMEDYITGSVGDTLIYVAIRGLVPTQTLDLSTGHTFTITPTEATDVLFSNPPASGTATGFTVEVDNSAGGYAITWPSSVKWHLGAAPTATATKELYTFVTTDGGTTYYGKLAGSDIA
jgi:hypothetical protein